MATADVLRVLYELEKPVLQRNDWPSLRIAVGDLSQQFLTTFPVETETAFDTALRELRLDGKVMLFPPWDELSDQGYPHGSHLHDSRAQWELANVANLDDQVPASWIRRKVFLPESLRGWFVRSRTAELTRLLAWNRERFGLAPSSAHVGYELQARFRPRRIPGGINQAAIRLRGRAQNGNFSRATRFDDPRAGTLILSAADCSGQAVPIPSPLSRKGPGRVCWIHCSILSRHTARRWLRLASVPARPTRSRCRS